MKKNRLDQELVYRGLVTSRSQAESYIKLGKVKAGAQVIDKPGYLVNHKDPIELLQVDQYVGRAALKLASVADKLGLDFKDKIVLDVGSSTGGFTDYALRQGVAKVIAVDVGTEQLHPSLRSNPRVELHEKTDIRNFRPKNIPDIVLIDVSFISLREILPTIVKMVNKDSQIVAMLKPQFESNQKDINKGVIKNDSIRRQILKDFESWIKRYFKVVAKAESEVAGAKGNLEKFYLLKRF